MVDSYDPHGSYGGPILFTVHNESDNRSEGSVSLLRVICCEKDKVCEDGVTGDHQVFLKARKERTSQLGQSNRSGSICSPLNTDFGSIPTGG